MSISGLWIQDTSEVAAVLGELGLDYVEDFQLETGLLRLDIALPGSQITVSLDSAAAFFANQPQLPTGATILNWRLLTLRGWKVRFWTPFFPSARRCLHFVMLWSGACLWCTEESSCPDFSF